eukprot:744431-Pyramimonas_sp.AAC.4
MGSQKSGTTKRLHNLQLMLGVRDECTVFASTVMVTTPESVCSFTADSAVANQQRLLAPFNSDAIHTQHVK